MNWKVLKSLTMKEKEASPRKASTPRKASKQLAMDVTIKTQMKKRADASRSTVKERQKDNKDGTKKKEVKFSDSVQNDREVEPSVDDDPHNQSIQEQEETPRDINTSTDSIKEEDKINTTLEGDEATPRDDNETATGENTTIDENGEKEGATENKGTEEGGGPEGEEKKEEDDDDKDDKKGKKGGKKKGGKNKSKREKKKVEKPKPVEMPQGEVTAGTEEFRTFIFDKVQSALEIVCTDGVTETSVDNVTTLLKSLDIDTSDEGLIDLMRDALVDNFGIINPLDLDQVVQKSQEANELTEMDDCLEVAFKLIDFDEDEFITQKDIYKLGLRLGEELAEFALDEMVDAVDMDKDGKVSLRDFRYFLLGRDVPSRKEIFAMAEVARKKREDEEERKRVEEEKIENERQAKLYQKMKDGEIIEMEGTGEEGEEEETSNRTSEEGGEELETDRKTGNENLDEIVEEKVEEEEEEEKAVEVKETAPKTEAELLREKRKNMFAGYANAVAAVNILSKAASPRDDGGDGGDSKTCVRDDSNDKNDDVFNDNNDNEGFHNDFDFDNDDESDREELGPLPLQTSLHNLNLPPPDLSTVSHVFPSPSSTPSATPRRPTIVGIGGLGFEMSDEFTEAIHRLEGDMMLKADNRVPERPHRRRSTCSSIGESVPLNVADDVEDYNNRLVFKLPPRRKSLCTPPTDAQQRRNSGNTTERRNSHSKCAMATDSDEGIDLADEEMVEPTVISRCGASAPSVSLRISLPNGDESEGAIAYDEDKMNVAIVTRKGRRRSSASSTSIRIDERGISTLGVGPYSDTPRSTSRSEFSVTHISLVSPRLTDDEEDNDTKYNNDDDDLETTTSKAANHTASNTSGYDCDGDSLALSIHDDDDDKDNQKDTSKTSEKLSYYKKGRLKKRVKLKPQEELNNNNSDREPSPTPSLTRRKSTPKMLKRNLSCNKIEIKELALNEPVPVGQFSNRHKFGMIPRDVSKFIVLGKNPSGNDQLATSSSILETEEDEFETLKKKSPKVRWQELPDMIRPILKNNKEPRKIVFTPPVKEQNVLQGRRLSLLNDFASPVLKNRQSFDLPILPDKIQIPTGNESSSNISALDNIRKMERKILKRSKTTFELPSLYEGQSDGGLDTQRSDISKSRRGSRPRRPLSARRKSSPVPSYDSDGSGRLTARDSGRLSAREGNSRYSARNRQVSIVDLSKSLRRDSACKDTASLSKKHSGFKSIVPLARVVMAYQSSKKKQRENGGGFYSISRQLEKSGVPFNSTSSSMSNLSPRRAMMTDHLGSKYKPDKKRRCRSAKGRSASEYFTSSKNENEDMYNPIYDEDVHTLVGDLKDPDSLSGHVVFQKVRPATAHAGMSSRGLSSSNPKLNGSMSGSRSNIVTLEIPESNKFEKKLKNVSLLSKLPIK